MFAYCGNNPVNSFDPTGEDWKDVFAVGVTIAIIGLIIVAAIPTGGGSLLLAGAGGAAAATLSTATVAEAGAAIALTGTAVAGGALINAMANSLPTSGAPNSTDTLNDDNGDIKQERHYDSTGKAEYDIDYKHSGSNHKFPHAHRWDWTKTPPRQPAIPVEELF